MGVFHAMVFLTAGAPGTGGGMRNLESSLPLSETLFSKSTQTRVES